MLFIEVEQDLGIRCGGKAMSAGLQLRAQFLVVEDFAVENDPQRFVFVADRLLPCLQIDDTEPCAPESCLRIAIDSEFIRPAVPDGGKHPAHLRFRDWLPFPEIEDTGDTTHQRRSPAAATRSGAFRRSTPASVRISSRAAIRRPSSFRWPKSLA